MHGGQDAVAARLQGIVEVLAHRRNLGHGRDGLGSQVLRVGAGVADATDALDRAHPAQQLGEQRAPGGEVTAVGVDVLAEEGDLGDAVDSQAGDVGHQVVQWPADLGAADGRHDAKGAAVVAAGLDADPRRPRHLAAGGQLPSAALGVGAVEHLDLGSAGGPGLGQEVADGAHVVGAEDGVDERRPIEDGLAVALGGAPADGDLHAGPALLQRLEVTEGPVQLVVGVLPDGAGGEDDDVGLPRRGDGLEPLAQEQAPDALGVVLVHLAPEGANVERAGLGGGRGHSRPTLPAASSGHVGGARQPLPSSSTARAMWMRRTSNIVAPRDHFACSPWRVERARGTDLAQADRFSSAVGSTCVPSGTGVSVPHPGRRQLVNPTTSATTWTVPAAL